MKISVIIPTYNESNAIGECIASLAKQTYHDFEIIVVDDGSTDETPEKISSRVTTLHQNHLGAGAARNLGVKRASGEILVFVDADMTFDKNFLKNLVKPILSGSAKGTFSKYEYVSNWENVWARCWNINQNWEGRKRHPRNYPDKQKVFRAILKKEFDKVEGFTPGGYTDDYSLYDKLGYMAVSTPGVIFYHKNPSSLKEVFNHARWVGKRGYKLGAFGQAIGIVRASLAVSFMVGTFKAFINMLPQFLVFKLVYDFGILIGILEMILTGKRTK